MQDIYIYESKDGGEFCLLNRDLRTVEGLANQVYLALFAGNLSKDWWGNEIIELEHEKFNGTFEQKLKENNLTAQGIRDLENSAEHDLKYLKKYALVKVEITLQNYNRIRINVKVGQENVTFLWFSTQQDLESAIIGRCGSVVPPPQIDITTNFLQIYNTCNNVIIDWDTKGYVPFVKIEIYRKITDSWDTLENILTNTGTYNYTFQIASENAKIRVSDAYNSIIYDESTEFNILGIDIDFKTQRNAGESIIATITGSGESTICWGDGTIDEYVAGISDSHTYISTDDYNVKILTEIYILSELDLSINNISEIDFNSEYEILKLRLYDNNLTGILDLSNVKLTTELVCYLNPNLTGITHSTVAGQEVRSYQAYSCNLTGTLDLSNIKLTYKLYVYNNPNLTGITHSTIAGQEVSNYYVYDCDLTGTHDLSNIKLTNIFISYNNPNLIGITHSTISGQIISEYYVYDCDLTGTHDLSNIKLTNKFEAFSNPNLTQITHSTVAGQEISVYKAYSCDLTGILDLSNVKLTAKLYLWINPNLTQITHSTVAGQEIDSYRANNCDLTGTHDLSNIKLTNIFYLWTNPNLTQITHSTVAGQEVSGYNVNSCNLTGTLDLSNIKLTNGIACYLNPNLTGITHSTISGQEVRSYQAYSCNLTGTHDLSNIKLTNKFEAFSNPNLTQITHSTVAGQEINIYNVHNCDLNVLEFEKLTLQNNCIINFSDNNMTAAEINENLTKIDSDGAIDGTLTANGTNAAPDTTSGGFNGTAAITNLQSKGWTVVTN